jgi:hypothetical protein
MKRRDPDPVQTAFHTADIPPAFLLAAERLINRMEALADGENSGAVMFSLAFLMERKLRETAPPGGPVGRLATLTEQLGYVMATLALMAAEHEDAHFTRQQ